MFCSFSSPVHFSKSAKGSREGAGPRMGPPRPAPAALLLPLARAGPGAPAPAPPGPGPADAPVTHAGSGVAPIDTPAPIPAPAPMPAPIPAPAPAPMPTPGPSAYPGMPTGVADMRSDPKRSSRPPPPPAAGAWAANRDPEWAEECIDTPPMLLMSPSKSVPGAAGLGAGAWGAGAWSIPSKSTAGARRARLDSRLGVKGAGRGRRVGHRSATLNKRRCAH